MNNFDDIAMWCTQPPPTFRDLCDRPKTVERRVLPSDPGSRAYTYAQFGTFVAQQFTDQHANRAREEARLTLKYWGESASDLSCWRPMSTDEMLGLSGAIVVCTAARHLSGPIKSWFRPLHIQVSAGFPGDACASLGDGGDWYQRWGSRTITAAVTAACLLGERRVVLVFLSAGPDTGSQREWAGRRDIAARISEESEGLVTHVDTAVVDPDEVCARFGSTQAEHLAAWQGDT